MSGAVKVATKLPSLLARFRAFTKARALGGSAALDLGTYPSRRVQDLLARGVKISGHSKGPQGSLQLHFSDGSRVRISPQELKGAPPGLGTMRPNVGGRLVPQLTGKGGEFRETVRSRFGRVNRQLAADSPVSYAAGAALGTTFLADAVGEPLFGGIKGALMGTVEPVTEQFLEMDRAGRAARMGEERMLRAVNANSERLAQLRPDLYNAVLANRRLPPDATPIGGMQRTDLLEELARAMAQQGGGEAQ